MRAGGAGRRWKALLPAAAPVGLAHGLIDFGGCCSRDAGTCANVAAFPTAAAATNGTDGGAARVKGLACGSFAIVLPLADGASGGSARDMGDSTAGLGRPGLGRTTAPLATLAVHSSDMPPRRSNAASFDAALPSLSLLVAFTTLAAAGGER